MTKLIAVIASVFTASIFLAPLSANATCVQTIYAERAFVSPPNTQVLGRISSSSTLIWFATTPNSQLANLIYSAVAVRNRLTIVGNATSCPNGGFMGTIIQIIQQP